MKTTMKNHTDGNYSFDDVVIIDTVIGKLTTKYNPPQKGAFPALDKKSYYIAYTQDNSQWGKGITRDSAVRDLFNNYVTRLNIIG